MGKVSNTLSILTLLSGGKKYTTKELSELIEVTPRQIRSYMEELEKAGIYVESVKGRYGGYYYQSNNYDYKVNFDINEVNTLETIYLSLKDSIKDEKLIESLSLIIEKMRYMVLYSGQINSSMSEGENKKMYKILANAINNNTELLIEVNKDNKIVKKTFIPQSIYVNSNNYYVTGYCTDIKDLRTYPFSIIKKINK